MLASSLISQANGELIEEANSHMHTKEIGEGGMAMVYAHEHAIVPRDSVRASASFLRCAGHGRFTIYRRKNRY